MIPTTEGIIEQLEKDFFFQFYAQPDANEIIKKQIVEAVLKAKERIEYKMTPQEVFTALVGRGATQASVHFEGGNDEGYCDEISLKDDAGNEVLSFTEYPEPPAGDRQLVTALCEPVYDRYGSFAGDFSVSGYCIWKDGHAKLQYSESEYVDHDEEVR